MKKKICTFGDSIMRGVVSDEKGVDGKPIYKVSDMGFVNRCEQKLGVRILNFSCFGSTTSLYIDCQSFAKFNYYDVYKLQKYKKKLYLCGRN